MTTKDKDRLINAILASVTSFIVAFSIYSFQVNREDKTGTTAKIEKLQIEKASKVELNETKTELINYVDKQDQKLHNDIDSKLALIIEMTKETNENVRALKK